MNNAEPIHISGVNYESMVDGDGVRTTIFFSGCPHHCLGCHNPETWSPDTGEPATDELISRIADEINKRPYIRGITLSGGDPFMMPDKTFEFLDKLLGKIKDGKLLGCVWAYTGYTFEELLSIDTADIYNLLDQIAVLIDGRFEEAKANRTLLFRGSSNQRIIDVSESYMASAYNEKPTVILWRGGVYDRDSLQLS